MKCDWCEGPFSPARSWQRFCSAKCRNDWNNREKVRQQIEAAEAAREYRINGYDRAEAGEKINLEALGLVPAAQPVHRRRFAT
jgi:hypothetical protein